MKFSVLSKLPLNQVLFLFLFFCLFFLCMMWNGACICILLMFLYWRNLRGKFWKGMLSDCECLGHLNAQFFDWFFLFALFHLHKNIGIIVIIFVCLCDLNFMSLIFSFLNGKINLKIYCSCPKLYFKPTSCTSPISILV